MPDPQDTSQKPVTETIDLVEAEKLVTEARREVTQTAQAIAGGL